MILLLVSNIFIVKIIYFLGKNLEPKDLDIILKKLYLVIIFFNEKHIINQKNYLFILMKVKLKLKEKFLNLKKRSNNFKNLDN